MIVGACLSHLFNTGGPLARCAAQAANSLARAYPTTTRRDSRYPVPHGFLRAKSYGCES